MPSPPRRTHRAAVRHFLPDPRKLPRRVVVLLALGGDVAVYAIGQARTDDLPVVLFAFISVLAGVAIAQWRAVSIGFGCVVIAAFLPTGTEDSQGFLIVFAGIVFGALQAVLIAVAVGAAKLYRRWFGRGLLDDPALPSGTARLPSGRAKPPPDTAVIPELLRARRECRRRALETETGDPRCL